MPAGRRAGVLALVAAAATLGGAGAAGAQATSCAGGAGLSPAQVTIDTPAPNETVSGAVTVRGSARVGLLGTLNRVEVTLGGVTRVQTFEPGTTLTYNVSVDASALPAGNTPLKVAACGSLAWGERSIAVTVAAPATTTTTARATTTTADDGAGPGTTVAGATTTSVGAGVGAGGQAGGQAGGTTSTRVSTSTTVSAAAPTTAAAPAPATTTTTAAPRSAPGREPLVLTETPAQSSSGPPVWVGAVVGISGGLGLLFTARPWRRRGGGRGLAGDAGYPAEEVEELVP